MCDVHERVIELGDRPEYDIAIVDDYTIGGINPTDLPCGMGETYKASCEIGWRCVELSLGAVQDKKEREENPEKFKGYHWDCGQQWGRKRKLKTVSNEQYSR